MDTKVIWDLGMRISDVKSLGFEIPIPKSGIPN